ncbi:xanthine dehydrogenase family protein molybdopterin-binding subunit [uncultured Jatrophihabitans sp.]|uniref:xanthine dehydrogenase family protein molybdopterin-binding subunit n=1 Tax=uncultured Jatrophihabitans sp. TaxID=1610747 RepID=UPI0035C95B3F
MTTLGTRPTDTSTLGAPVARIEGPLKVTGSARYAAEHPQEGLLHAWVVQAPVAKGTVRSVDVPAGLALPGVVAVIWHGNAPSLKEADDAELSVLQSAEIAYRGQPIALVVATSPEDAREAVRVLSMEIDEDDHDTEIRLGHPGFYAPPTVNPAFDTDSVIGDPDRALDAAAVVLDETYSTSPLNNNPMEPHATVARWDADRLTVWDSTQHAPGVAGTLATLFDVAPENAHVLNEHVGGGFGSKGSARPNVVLAALAARVVGQPVQLALPRQALFSLTGYRTPTISRVRLGADAEGHLTAVSHEVWEQSSTIVEFAEQTAVATRHMYAAPDRRTTHRLVRLDVPSPRWMRAPGEAPGMFALESAMDELADKLGIDPIVLRERNEPDEDPEEHTPFSSRHYLDCLHAGAERFGWAARDPRPRRTRDGEWWVGTGVAGATYPAMSMPSSARVSATPDGRFQVAVAASDIGQGARTVLTQIAADALGCWMEDVDISIGDSALPMASVAGGSSGTASWGRAIVRASEQLLRRIDGPIPPDGLSATYDTTDELEDQPELSQHAFGAHFVEARVNAVTGEVRVPRMLGVFAAGNILNERLARSQFLGAMTMGLGMALHEEEIMDPHTGDYVNHDLAEYHVASHADIGDLQVLWLPESDDSLNPMGSKGIGEIGIVGTAAAVANAVWHATGVRVRDLPIRLDKLLDGVLADG